MAIQVKCKCGKGFAVKDEMQGKKAKCPACGEILVIGHKTPAAPATSGAISVTCPCGKAISAPAKLAGKQVKCPGCGKPLTVPTGTAKSKDPNDLSDLLDEIGYDQEKTKDSCPECSATLTPNAVLCVACGYNLETGKKLKTKSYAKLAQKRMNRTKLK